LLGDGKRHAKARAGVGRRVVNADPSGGGCGASDGYAQGCLRSSPTPEDGSWDAVVLQAGAGREGPRVDVVS